MTARRIALPVIGTALVAACWELAVMLIGNPGLFPPLERVAAAFGHWGASGLLVTDIAESVPRAVLALCLATPLGIMFGLGLALSRRAGALFDGVIQLMRSLPPVALLPLFILWFGIGWNAKVAASVFVCMFPVIVTTMQATTQVDQTYRELAHDLRLTLLAYIARIVVPGAFPAIVPGIRLAAGTSFVMVFVSELAGASAGLGYRISIAQLAYQADLMIAGLLTLGLAGLAVDTIIAVLGRRLLHYAGR